MEHESDDQQTRDCHGEGVLKSSSMELSDERVDMLSLEARAGDEMLLLPFRKGEAEPRAEELMECEISFSLDLVAEV